LTSIPVGCVTFTRGFFSGGRITAAAMNRAENAAARAVAPLEGTYGKGNWRRAVGSSGTVKAVGKILRRQECRGKAIRAEALADLRQSLLDCGRVERLSFRGLDPERAPILPAGVAILSGIFSALEIGVLKVSKYALREGLLHEMILRED